MTQPWNHAFERFAEIFERAKVSQPKDPNAVTLATVDEAGNPSARVVLMKGFDPRGFVVFTNRESSKGRDLSGQQVAALCFYWPSMEEQVRVEGTVSLLPDAESDEYFASRGRNSQLGAWASLQSQPMKSREVLDARLLELAKKYEGQPVPRPPHWGGYLISPLRMEFWKAHPDRLHWREAYVKRGEGWDTAVLYP